MDRPLKNRNSFTSRISPISDIVISSYYTPIFDTEGDQLRSNGGLRSASKSSANGYLADIRYLPMNNIPTEYLNDPYNPLNNINTINTVNGEVPIVSSYTPDGVYIPSGSKLLASKYPTQFNNNYGYPINQMQFRRSDFN